MSFRNKKITLSASNLFSIAVTDKVLAFVWKNKRRYQLSNLTIKQTKVKDYLLIETFGEITKSDVASSVDSRLSIECVFHIQNFASTWAFRTGYPIVKFRIVSMREIISLSIKDDGTIFPWNDLDKAKLKELYIYHPDK